MTLSKAVKLERERKHYCIDHEHSPVVTYCLGYVSCARCEQQLGDTLGGAYNLKDSVLISHIGKGYPECNCTENAKNLKPRHLKLLPPEIIEELKAALKMVKGQ